MDRILMKSKRPLPSINYRNAKRVSAYADGRRRYLVSQNRIDKEKGGRKEECSRWCGHRWWLGVNLRGVHLCGFHFLFDHMCLSIARYLHQLWNQSRHIKLGEQFDIQQRNTEWYLPWRYRKHLRLLHMAVLIRGLGIIQSRNYKYG